MSNGKLPANGKPMVVYAEECDPDKNDDWFEVKRRTFGGDDGVDFIDAESLEAMITASPQGTHLGFTFTDDAMQIAIIERG